MDCPSWNALQAVELVAVPHQDAWRLPYLVSLLSQRRIASQSAMDIEVERINELISSLVMNHFIRCDNSESEINHIYCLNFF